MTPFGVRLAKAIETHGAFCAGIDPHRELLEAWDLDDDPKGLRKFAQITTEAFAGQVAAVKPQSAFFERHGSAGIAVLEDLIAEFRDAGTLVILDVKRGDIGSTAAAYAEAYLRPSSPLAVDAITASPFLGLGSLDPMLDLAGEQGAGVFVLALTSNLEAGSVQRAAVPADRAAVAGQSVAGAVLAGLAARNHTADPAQVRALGSFGAVVGASLPAIDENLDFGGPILAPGVGAQGGSVESVRRLFAGVLERVLPTSSREILRQGPDAEALREAARRASDEFTALVR